MKTHLFAFGLLLVGTLWGCGGSEDEVNLDTNPPICGNGVVEGDGCLPCGGGEVCPMVVCLFEECDDGNTTSWDGCSGTCQHEIPAVCQVCCDENTGSCCTPCGPMPPEPTLTLSELAGHWQWFDTDCDEGCLGIHPSEFEIDEAGNITVSFVEVEGDRHGFAISFTPIGEETGSVAIVTSDMGELIVEARLPNQSLEFSVVDRDHNGTWELYYGGNYFSKEPTDCITLEEALFDQG